MCVLPADTGLPRSVTDIPLRYRVSTRRSAELGLLVGAWLIGVLAWTLVDVATGSSNIAAWSALAGAGLLMLAAHSVIRWQVPYADPILFPAVSALNMLGLAMIHRLDIASAQHAATNNLRTPTPDVFLQITWMTLGLTLFIGVLLFLPDHRLLQRATWTSGLAGIVLLLLPMLPLVGREENGARLWVRVAGMSFQPGEFAKVALTFFFAGFLVTRRHTLALVTSKVMGVGFPRMKDAGPLLVVWLLAIAVLVVQHDLGTSLLLFGLFLVMLYLATSRRSWVLIGVALLAVGAIVAYFAFGHVRLRFQVWLHPFDDPVGNGFQIVQSMYGLAGGGLFGTGWGMGYPHMVPFAKTDFIAAALGEELGLAGMVAIILLYAVIIERGSRAATATRDAFGSLLAMGLTAVIGLQTFIVIGGVTRLIPLTGLTTPFLSYGGSSLLANYIILGILMRVSNAARAPEIPMTTTAVQALS